ncbi:hypothetical protein LCGC14_0767210 [marine sediment metagenome]|uniref:Polymerase beta nucleotidyltransferase domain-containing protein n=1 Tax=marine sediment metagenome TaxID=412755 RepID=A0A0F9QJ73_9ZZZZ
MKRPKYKIVQIEELKSVVDALFMQFSEIQIAYLYGSYAKELQNEFSDIDIGIVLENDFKESPLYFAKLCSKIEEIYSYKIEVDLRVINNSSPRFLFQVIKNARTLYVKDINFKDEYELKVMNQYLDIKPMLDEFDRISIQEVLGDEY